MSCLNPTQAWQDMYRTTKGGKHPVIFSFKELSSDFYSWKDAPGGAQFVSNRYVPLSLPCGHCILCRKTRAYEITCRALMEKLAHPGEPATFVTLTCSDENLPLVFPGGVLHHRPWQLFAKRLRKKVGSFRFLMCGEYGEQTKRPHYHAIIYGHRFNDFQWLPDGSRCESVTIRDCWSYGNIRSVPATDNTIAYVAGYQLKLDNEQLDVDALFECPELYESVDDDKLQLKNYVKWSRNPGLGYDFLLRFPNMIRNLEQTAPDGFKYDLRSFSLVRGKKMMPFHSRYLMKILEAISNGEGYYDKLSINQFTELYKSAKFLSTPLRLRREFDILQASKERGMFQRQLHSPPDCARVDAERLKNRAAILDIQLAAKKRDLSA